MESIDDFGVGVVVGGLGVEPVDGLRLGVEVGVRVRGGRLEVGVGGGGLVVEPFNGLEVWPGLSGFNAPYEIDIPVNSSSLLLQKNLQLFSYLAC